MFIVVAKDEGEEEDGVEVVVVVAIQRLWQDALKQNGVFPLSF